MYANPQLVIDQTRALADEGVRLLNFWRLADTEPDHVRVLLDLLDLPESAHVVDLGSGTGEFARLAHYQRSDLHFTLVNDNAWQLEQSPEWAVQCHRDMADTGLPANTYDAVVLAYALGHGDVAAVLEEAHRLLKPGGKLLLHDVHSATATTADHFESTLDYRAHNPALLRYWAALVGFDHVGFVEDTHLAPGDTVRAAADTGLFEGMTHGVTLFEKSDRPHRLRGRRAALQFSGGKDSLACLYLLRPFLKDITVYHLNTGDAIPETTAVVDAVRGWIPNFVEVKSDVVAWRTEHGMPSDLVPAHSHTIGRMYGMSETRISNRFDCCLNNLMLPLHRQVKADGIDLLIRGTKLADTGAIPAEGWHDGVEIWLPVRDFTHEDVFGLLRDVGAPVSPVYEFATSISAPECLGCTAWWDDRKGEYLKARHPDVHATYIANLREIEREITTHLVHLRTEMDTEN
jgi:phosphoadenosine phosphosulfate reductase